MNRLTVKNSNPIQENFLGFNAVYHGYAGMSDKDGRELTEELCELEADRAKDQNIKIARTFYSWISWDDKKKTWDWNNHDFNAFCSWIKRMKDRGIDVALNPASILDIMSEGYRGRAPFTVDGDFIASAEGYATWVSETLHQIIDVRGLTNLKYILYFTEPQFAYTKTPSPKGTKDNYDVWYKASKILENKLKLDGFYERLTFIGPNEGGTANAQMMKWVNDNHLDMVDMFSSHNYSKLLLDKAKLTQKTMYVAGGRWYCPVKLTPEKEYELSFKMCLETDVDSNMEGSVYVGLFKAYNENISVFSKDIDKNGSLTDTWLILDGSDISKAFKEVKFKFIAPSNAEDILLGFFDDIKNQNCRFIIDDISLKESNTKNEILDDSKWGSFPNNYDYYVYTQYDFFYRDVTDKLSLLNNKDNFCYDEYNCFGYRFDDSLVKRIDHPIHGTDLAAARVAFLNTGVKNSFMWSLFDQQWPNNHTTNDDDFVDGDHRLGVMPSLLRSKVPYPAYFATRITGLVNGDENSKIYKGIDDGVVKGAMVENSSGDITVLLVNETHENQEFEVEFEKTILADLNCYVYNPQTVVCEETIPKLKPEFTEKGVTTHIRGVISAGGVMAYSTK